jgi:hypothetical protein
MTLDLTDDEAAPLLKELNGLIDGDRYFLSDRVKTLQAIRAKIRPERVREPMPPPPKQYAPPRASCGKETAQQALRPSRASSQILAVGPAFVRAGPHQCLAASGVYSGNEKPLTAPESVIQICENWLGGLDQIGIRVLGAIKTQPSASGIG